MDEDRALAGFAAMSQETRLRLLGHAGPEGLAAGAIGGGLGGATTWRRSLHLTHLEQAGLVRAKREGRFIIHSVVPPALAWLVQFMMRDCGQGHPEICASAFHGCFPAREKENA